MNGALTWPWLEMTCLLPLVGAVAVQLVSGVERKWRICLATTAVALGCSLVPWLLLPGGAGVHAGLFRFRGEPIFSVDGLSAPLLPATALMHFLIVLATARTKLPRLSFSWLLVSEATRLGIFACMAPWPLIAVLAVGTIPPFADLVRRGRPRRVYVLHMSLFVALMVVGWALVEAGYRWGSVALLVAVLLRSGTIPMHLWVADLFEHASFAVALLFLTPITGVYAAMRLVLPVAPDWILSSLGVFSIVTAVYAAGMAIVQREARRFFAYLFLSHSSLVMLGLELHTAISLTGALCLWYSVMLSLGGLGLTIRAIEARYRRLSLADHHGLYELSPALAVCFLVTGLASVGFPGTLGYISTELLVDGAVGANLWVGVGVVLAGTLNSIAVLRAYWRLFTGTRAVSPVELRMFPRERFAVLLLTAVILGGGLFPQPGIRDRFGVAESLLQTRALEGRPARVTAIAEPDVPPASPVPPVAAPAVPPPAAPAPAPSAARS
jgi:NADH-quinone oxidoreductase subunit M